jgi:hypothetical protein
MSLVLGLVSDLFFSAQIENVVKAQGCAWRLIERGGEIEPPVVDTAPDRPGEPVQGASAAWIAQLVEWQPALIVLELSSAAIPWARWIAALKSSPATRRIGVIAFGPHTDLDLRATAFNVGCDEVVAKSRLASVLPEMLNRHARRVDVMALETECASALSPMALQGIALFDAGAYFEAHEALEHAWNADPGPARELYRGLLQIAVAYLQITRGNYTGALKMFLRARQWLDPLPDQCRGVHVAHLRAAARAARAELERLGPARIAEFDQALFKPIPLVK